MRTRCSVSVSSFWTVASCVVLLASLGCDDGGFTHIPEPDAGVDAGPEPEPPAPPLFPLKAGDTVEVPVIGASVNDPCSLGEGFCDRGIFASYVIESVSLNEQNYWEIDATYVYEVTKADTSPPLDAVRSSPLWVLPTVNGSRLLAMTIGPADAV